MTEEIKTEVLDRMFNAFQADDGSMVLFNEDRPRWVYYRTGPEGYFQQLYCTGHFFVDLIQKHIPVVDETKGVSMTFILVDSSVFLGTQRFTLIKTPEVITVVPMQPVRQIEYIFKRLVGGFIVVTSQKLPHPYDYESFRIYLVKRLGKRILPTPIVSEVTRYRDGGTTYIITKAGTLFSPPPPQFSNKRPRWTPPNSISEDLEILNREKYTFEESEKGLVLRKAK